VATLRVTNFAPSTRLGEAEKSLAAGVDSLTGFETDTRSAPENSIALDPVFLQVLRSGEDSLRSPEAIVWGINFLRQQTGVLPRLNIADLQSNSDVERVAFLIDAIEIELRRQRLIAFLNCTEPAWKEEDHPDIAAVGAAAWVHNLRREKSARLADRDEFLDPA
jgi:hypothetical protein